MPTGTTIIRPRASPPANEAIYQPYDIKEPYYDSFHMFSLKVSYDMAFANLTSASSYWQRDVYQSTDSTEALQNIFNYTAFVPNLYKDNDTHLADRPGTAPHLAG